MSKQVASSHVTHFTQSLLLRAFNSLSAIHLALSWLHCENSQQERKQEDVKQAPKITFKLLVISRYIWSYNVLCIIIQYKES